MVLTKVDERNLAIAICAMEGVPVVLGWRTQGGMHKDAGGALNRSSLLAKAERFIRVTAPEIFRCEA